MKTKKIIALLLVLATALLVCVSCAGGGEPGDVSYKVINSTGENLAIVILKEKVDKGQVWTVTNMVPDQEGEFTVYTNLNNGAPNLEFKVTTQSGVEYSMDLNQKGDKVITIMQDPNPDDTMWKLITKVEDKN